jgi:hypothetical protein
MARSGDELPESDEAWGKECFAAQKQYEAAYDREANANRESDSKPDRLGPMSPSR